MSDPLRHVTAGDPLVIRAETWNQILDAVKITRSSASKTDASSDDSAIPALTISVRNDTGQSLPVRSIVAIQSPILPSSGPSPLPSAQLQSQPLFTAIAPQSADDIIGICIERIPSEGVGRVAILGSVVCDVLVNDDDHQYAVPEAGQTAYLQSASSGAIRIAWVADAATPPANPDVRRAVVVLGYGATQAATGGSVWFARIKQESGGKYSWQERVFNSSGNEIDGSKSGTHNARPLPHWAGQTLYYDTLAIIWKDSDDSDYVFMPIVDADKYRTGFVNTTTQTFKGPKTFLGNFAVRDAGETIWHISTDSNYRTHLAGSLVTITSGIDNPSSTVYYPFVFYPDGIGFYNQSLGVVNSYADPAVVLATHSKVYRPLTDSFSLARLPIISWHMADKDSLIFPGRPIVTLGDQNTYTIASSILVRDPNLSLQSGGTSIGQGGVGLFDYNGKNSLALGTEQSSWETALWDGSVYSVNKTIIRKEGYYRGQILEMDTAFYNEYDPPPLSIPTGRSVVHIGTVPSSNAASPSPSYSGFHNIFTSNTANGYTCFSGITNNGQFSFRNIVSIDGQLKSFNGQIGLGASPGAEVGVRSYYADEFFNPSGPDLVLIHDSTSKEGVIFLLDTFGNLRIRGEILPGSYGGTLDGGAF